MSLISTLLLAFGGLFLDIAPDPVPRDGITLSVVGKTPVSMDAEVVTIDVHADYADVRALFSMRNTSKRAVSLEVGFPGAAQAASWTLGSKGVTVNSWAGTKLRRFQATVDGKAVKAVCKQPPGTERAYEQEGVYENWYLWPVTFTGCQKREVLVSYRIPTRDANYTAEGILKHRKFAYVLKTGAGWHGPIGSARIIVRSKTLQPFHVTRVAPKPSKRTAAGLVWEYRAFEPTSDIVVEYSVHADAARALAAFEANLRKRPADLSTRIDVAIAREAVGETAKAADSWRALAEGAGDGDTTPTAPGGYVPAEHQAARLYRKAGRDAEARAVAAKGAKRLERFLKRMREGSNTWWMLNKMYGTSEEALDKLLAELRAWARAKR